MRYQTNYGRCNPDTGEMTFPADTRPFTTKKLLLVLCGALPFAFLNQNKALRLLFALGLV